MEFDDLDRKTANTWRDYVNDVKEMGAMLKWVWQELINDTGKAFAKKMFWLQLACCAVAVISPWTLSYVFNGLNPNIPNLNFIILGIGMFVVVSLLSQGLNYLSWRSREFLFGENQRQLDKRTTELFLEKSLGMHQDESNLLTDANIRKGYERVFHLQAMILFEGVDAVLMLFLPFIALWIINWQVGILASVMILSHLLWSVFLNQKMFQECIPIDKKWRAMNRRRVEILDNVERVKNEDQAKEEVFNLGQMFEQIIHPDRKFWLWFIKQVMLRGLMDYWILVAIIILGCYQVWTGVITLGLLYPLYNWSRQLTENLWRIGHIEHQINFVTPSILAMKQALSLPIGIKLSDKPIKLVEKQPIELTFANVSYSYPVKNSENNDPIRHLHVLKDINFAVKPGEIVGLAGGSGIGKSTIIKLILHYMDPSSGQILINGVPLSEVDHHSWLPQVGYIPQSAQIFDGTIRDNLLYGVTNGLKEISDQELWQMIQPLQLDFGTRLIDGLQTKVGRNGIKLSGGQAQRLMIGAAILKRPQFLLIDEATSSLDPTTERLVQQGLEDMTPSNIGVLYITHRLQPMRRWCNKIIYLESNGEQSAHIGAIGSSFEELAEISPGFRKFAVDADIVL